jgi:hypothetical protein
MTALGRHRPLEIFGRGSECARDIRLVRAACAVATAANAIGAHSIERHISADSGEQFLPRDRIVSRSKYLLDRLSTKTIN